MKMRNFLLVLFESAFVSGFLIPPLLAQSSATGIGVKYEDGTEIKLKAEQQAAFTSVYAVEQMENYCRQLGRLCSLSELIQGIKTKDGLAAGFIRDPDQDPNYRYRVAISGEDYQAEAIPKRAGLGGFLLLGSKTSGYWYHYNPNGQATAMDKNVGGIDLSRMVEGFMTLRKATPTQPLSVPSANGDQTAGTVTAETPGTSESQKGPPQNAPSQESASQIGVPRGTEVSAYYEDGTEVKLKPEEQVALIFVSDMCHMEGACWAFLGRHCSLNELIKGVEGKDIAFNRNPDQDANYRYTITILPNGDYQAAAIPRRAGLGGFILLGSKSSFGFGEPYYNPNGGATAKDKRLEGLFIGGATFRLGGSSAGAEPASGNREATPTQTQSASGAPSQIGVPSGTQVSAKYEDGTEVKLKPEEQVALIFVNDISDMEEYYCHTDKPCSLDELIKGVKGEGPVRQPMRLTRDPNQDPNYHYTVSQRRGDIQVEAIPRRAGLGGFLFIGHNHYYNPNGAASMDPKDPFGHTPGEGTKELWEISTVGETFTSFTR